VKAGISTLELNDLIAEHTKKLGGICAPLGYKGYPKSCCISLNDVICHGIPNKITVLKEGDILNIDITTIYKGYYGDTSRMFAVGKISPLATKLISTTKQALDAAISICKPGVPYALIGEVIERVIAPTGFGIVRDFCGHGIGKTFHELPEICHFRNGRDGVMREGEVFTIEPMINTGTWKAEFDADGWTARTQDGGLSAQFEHTIGITSNGSEIFTE
jgi:methionyl aminopeptidase